MVGNRRTRRKQKLSSDSFISSDAFTCPSSSFSRPELSFLNEIDIERIKNRAFDLLADHGISIAHKHGYDALLKAGAKPGKEPDRLILPRELVDEALSSTPRETVLCGKRPERDVHLPRKDKGFIMRTGTGAHGFVVPETDEYRNMMITDIPTIAAVANGLDQVGFVAHPFSYGVHELTSDIHSVASLITHTDKHILLQPYNIENIEYLMRIVTTAAGGEEALKARPIASCIMCSFTPLEFKAMDIEALIQSGKKGIPVHACSLPSAGGTAPISVAGSVLMAITEILAMITLAHVLVPGTSIIATPLMFTLDMRTGRALHSCVESVQAKSIAIDVLKRGLGLICHTYGSGSDTPDVDVQSMAERALLGQLIALSGSDILGGVGQLECATVFSPIQAVLDNELGAFYRRLLQAPAINDQAFNWEEISTVEPGSHFLDSAHTIKNCRTQHFPDVFQRMGRDDYEAQNREGAFEAARDRVSELVKATPPDGLPDDDQIKEIHKITAEADKEIIDKAQSHKGKREVI